jgi:MFS transporter, SP family, general alpha glucoside:H+ symporter
MEAYCVFLMGNFVALPKFKRDFGHADDTGAYYLTTSWQSALQMGGPVGAFIGCYIAGPLTTKVGYRWATIIGLMLLNAFIFIFYFGKTLGVMLASQLLEGIPWGIFIANAPAYCSEIAPIKLRAPATQMLQWYWAIGAIIVGAVALHYNDVDEEKAYR